MDIHRGDSLWEVTHLRYSALFYILQKLLHTLLFSKWLHLLCSSSSFARSGDRVCCPFCCNIHSYIWLRSAYIESPCEHAIRNELLGTHGEVTCSLWGQEKRSQTATSLFFSGLDWEQPRLAHPVSKHLRFSELGKSLNLGDVHVAVVQHRTQRRSLVLLATQHLSHTASTCGVTAANASARVTLFHRWTAVPLQQLTPPKYNAAQCLNEQKDHDGSSNRHVVDEISNHVKAARSEFHRSMFPTEQQNCTVTFCLSILYRLFSLVFSQTRKTDRYDMLKQARWRIVFWHCENPLFSLPLVSPAVSPVKTMLVFINFFINYSFVQQLQKGVLCFCKTRPRSPIEPPLLPSSRLQLRFSNPAGRGSIHACIPHGRSWKLSVAVSVYFTCICLGSLQVTPHASLSS